MAVFFTLFQRNDIMKKEVEVLKEKCDNHLASVHVLKKTVERMREELRESEKEAKKAVNYFKLHETDKTGLVDYAYRGRVTATRGTEAYKSEGVSFLGMSICSQTYLEGRIVEPSAMPGDCWPIKGTQGSAMIELIDEINVSKISLEHAPKELLPNGTSSAPKEFSLLGFEEYENGSPHFFGRFIYFVNSTEVQTFPVQIPSSKPFKKVEVQVHSNHGHPDFTCVYRVRIHGDPKK